MPQEDFQIVISGMDNERLKKKKKKKIMYVIWHCHYTEDHTTASSGIPQM